MPTSGALIPKTNSNMNNSNYNDKEKIGTSLVVQWLRLHVSNAGDVGLMPG